VGTGPNFVEADHGPQYDDDWTRTLTASCRALEHNDGRQKRSVGTAVRLSVTVMSCLSPSHSLTIRVVVLVHMYAGLVQKPTSQVAQERTQPRDAQERFRRSIQRFHATV